MKRLELDIQFFAHKKGQTSPANGRDSIGRRLVRKLVMVNLLQLEAFFIVKEEQRYFQEPM